MSLIRQVYARLPAGDGLGDALADWLILDGDEVEQAVTLDLVAASVPDRQAPGHVCHDCLQRTMQAHAHY